MNGLASETYQEVRSALLECGGFADAAQLHNIFSHPHLQAWQSNVPQENDLLTLVEAVISRFYNRHRAGDKASVLALLLWVLSQRLPPQDACCQRLRGLALQLAPQLSPPDPPPAAPTPGPPPPVVQNPSPVPGLSALPPCPFVAGPMIKDPRLFVGRREPLRRLTNALSGAQPTSVNVVGERRMGKSSLLYHFAQTWDQRAPHPERSLVVYLNLQETSARNEEALYQALVEALRQRPALSTYPDLLAALSATDWTRPKLMAFLRQCTRQGLLLTFCWDEFESLFAHPHQFDNDFFDAWRACMNASEVMLILASKEPVDTYRRQYNLTSSFFNLGDVLRLGEMPPDEAAELVQLPASTVPAAAPALGLHEQELARAWGGGHPYLLQLAARCLCQAGHEGKDAAWARATFREQAQRLRPRHRWTRRLARAARALFWEMPQALGRTTHAMGSAIDDAKNWLVGVIILLVIALALLGVLTQTQLIDLVRHALVAGP
ncbi:MAG: AAA-like domain-containing protein [Anaerolineales bacterium]|nr:AAA-like domain-containing protein [Anaerolineales bacterium]